jgi:CRISPR-associated protein Csb2
MPTLILRFSAGHYHATPWGHHVNEGLIEWPPSPWRLLRALLATGYGALNWPGSINRPMDSTPPDEARTLILKLAGVLPRYRLPPAVGAHSRHYMPLAVLDKGRERTTLVLDTWAQVDDGEIGVTWQVELTSREDSTLGQLAQHLGYLGRSESWVEARLGPREATPPLEPNCFPCETHDSLGPGWEQVPLLAPLPPDHYAAWREPAVAEALAAIPPAGKKVPRTVLNQRNKAAASHPPDLIACLQADTTWLRSEGWSQPPGSQRVFYWRRRDALEAGTPRPRRRCITTPPVEVLLLAMATATGNDHALPNVTRTLPQAELLHRALVQTVHRQHGHSPVLSGCDQAGAPRKACHDHAHILPLDLDGDGHLEHVLIWAPMGLDEVAQAAVRAVRHTFTKGGVGPLKLALVAGGDPRDLSQLPGTYGEHIRSVLGPNGGATEWLSLTPFVAPRFVKTRGRNTLEGQLRAELASRGLPELVEVTVIQPHEDPTAARFRHFVRQRRSGAPAPIDCGFRLKLTLAAPATGPIALGYGSHFGLGMFMSPKGASV